MKKLLLFVIFGLSIFLLCPFLSSGQDIHFDLVPRPQDQGTVIFSLAQDNHGYLWLGTLNGLFKYDGNQYTAYHSQALNPNSISNDYIECVASDKQGYIWIGYYHNTSGIDRLDPSTGICTHFHHKENDSYSIASDSVTTIMQDHEGTVWIGTNNGLDRFDTKTNRFYHYQHTENDPASLSFNQVRAIYEDKEGTLWVGTGNTWLTDNPRKEGGLNKLDKKTGKFTRYLHNDKDPHSLIDDRVRAIFEDSHGNFWVGSAGDGLHKMDRKTGSFERLLYNPSHPDGLSRPPTGQAINGGEDHITFITEDNKGRLWIGTFNGGINVYDPATKKSSWYGSGKNSKENLPANSYWRAFKTKDGLLWISTWGVNLYKINPYRVNVPYTHIGAFVDAFAEDNSKTLWLGTNKGLVRRDSNGITRKFFLNNDSSSQQNRIRFIEKDDSNRLWLATWHGVYYFDAGTNKILGYHPVNGNANSFFQDTIIIIRKGKDNKLWLGTNKGLKLMDIKTGAVTLYQHDPKDSGSISNNVVLSIGNDENEDLWVGTVAGINRLNKHTGLFKRYPGKRSIRCLMEDSKEDLWAGTITGLFRYDKNADIFLPFIDASGIISTSEITFGIAEDDHQNLWLNTWKGILRMNKDRNGIVVFGNNQGVNPLSLQSFGYTRQNGDVLFGDSAGYFTFNISLLQMDTSRPIVTISSFLLNNIVVEPSPNGILSAPIEQTDGIRLNHDQNTFSFGFSSVDFVSDHTYRRVLYKLENYDNNWRLSNESREAYYFNLPPGKYVFKVKAYGANGGWDEKQIAVTIAPPWWQTWWAYTIYAIGFVMISFFANRFIRRRIIEKEKAKARERELAQAKEIEKAYTQLELAHENLKAAQSQLIQSEKMASLGELTAGIAHEIQNPLNFVNNFSEVNTELIEEMKSELEIGNKQEALIIADDIKQNLEKINHHGKRADAIVKGMLQHSRKSEGVKELTDINALCDEYLRLSYHGLRAKEKDFNADFKTDFDESVGKINIIPQDIGRVLLNLTNNAFYAVNEKKKQQPENYEPTVSIKTKKLDGKIEVSVKDNGNGIPQNVVDKIFQPFFTTKPTGQGTGLGLSLSYDIIKAHGGEIKVETKEWGGSDFTIQLPTG